MPLGARQRTGPSLVNPKELGSSQGESLDNVSGKPTSRLTATVGSGASKKEWVDDLADFMQPMLGSKGGPSLVQKAEHSDGTVVIDTLRTATFGEGPNMALEDLFRLGPWLAGLAVELEDVRKLRAMQGQNINPRNSIKANRRVPGFTPGTSLQGADRNLRGWRSNWAQVQLGQVHDVLPLRSRHI